MNRLDPFQLTAMRVGLGLGCAMTVALIYADQTLSKQHKEDTLDKMEFSGTPNENGELRLEGE